MQWDESVIEGDTRVRRAYFQDHQEAHVLEDRAGSYMTLRLIGQHDEPIAAASRIGSGRSRWFVAREGHEGTIITGKDAAIDLMLGRTG